MILRHFIRFDNEPELAQQGAEIILDGYDSEMETESGAYLYTAIYKDASITQIQQFLSNYK